MLRGRKSKQASIIRSADADAIKSSAHSQISQGRRRRRRREGACRAAWENA